MEMREQASGQLSRMNQPTEETNDEAEEVSESSSRHGSKLGVVVRVLLPLILIAAGIASYAYFSKEPPQIANPRPKPKPLEVRVEDLKRQDYQIRIPTNGVIQGHSQAGLTSQVAGRVDVIYPAFEVGAFFAKDDVLLELNAIDFEEALASAKAQLALADFNLAQEHARARQARLNWEDLGYDEEPNDLVLRIPHLKLSESQLKRANEQILSAQRNLERTKVRAPFDGRVLSRTAGVGQTVGAGASLGIIFATDYSEVRLPVSTQFLPEVTLPEEITDTPVKIVLRDGLSERTDVSWDAQILRTEGALDASTLELFAVARVKDPFGLHSNKVPLRLGQPVVSEIPGRGLTDVFVIPREAITELNRIRLVDPETHTLKSAKITQLWADDESVVFRDPGVDDGTLLVLDRLVYAPDGGKVEIVDDEALDEELDSSSVKEAADKK